MGAQLPADNTQDTQVDSSQVKQGDALQPSTGESSPSAQPSGNGTQTARKRHANGGIRCCAVSFQLIEGADEQPVADGS
jgi:hypothetical protein